MSVRNEYHIQSGFWVLKIVSSVMRLRCLFKSFINIQVLAIAQYNFNYLHLLSDTASQIHISKSKICNVRQSSGRIHNTRFHSNVSVYIIRLVRIPESYLKTPLSNCFTCDEFDHCCAGES